MSVLFSTEAIAILGLGIGIYSYALYLIGVFKGTTKPHIFSWVTWGFLTGIAWTAQLHEHAGPGAWVTGGTAFICLVIALLSFCYGEKTITRGDWFTFIAAILAIPLWYLTQSPLWSVILITVIDALAFYPTFRKSWSKPQEEVVTAYALNALKFGISLMAIENFNFITTFYSFSLVMMNSAFVVMVVTRRKVIYA